MAAAPWVVSDELWELVEPLLPVTERRFRYPGRKRLPDRQALQGILFVLHTGIAWTHLPVELGFGSGVTCWRRLDEWQRPGCGSGCTRCCSRGRARRESSSGHERSSTQARCRPKRGRRNGPEPGRPRPSRLEAPSADRRTWDAVGVDADRQQPERRDAVAAATRPCARGRRSSRTAAPAPTDRAWRPWLRL
jgi:transposase